MSMGMLRRAEMTVLPVAIGDSVGFVRSSSANRARAANSIAGYGSTQTGGVRKARALPCVTLDNLLNHFPAPHMLKIDVEGAELGILQGGEQILSHVRPGIYCEVSQQVSGDVTRLLNAHSYGLWDGSGSDGTSRPGISHATHNTVAIPTEKVEAYARLHG